MIGSTCKILGSGLTRESNGGRGAFGDGEVPDPQVALISPAAFDKPSGRMVFCFDKAQTLVRNGFHNDVLETR